jgi:putative colanic acid biosysnthesis UDP-glucose lipid carrier transferase
MNLPGPAEGNPLLLPPVFIYIRIAETRHLSFLKEGRSMQLDKIAPAGFPDLTWLPVSEPLIESPLYRRRPLVFKRAADLIISTLLFIPLMLILPFLAACIKLGSKGPVFFLQERHKRNGHVFTCVKLRTMEATGHDRRVTRQGKWLRKYHLDEWPQLLNVWWGDMSIVGPRPHMLSDNDKFGRLVENYTIRHTVKPGITGLAQVRGHIGPVRTPVDIHRRVRDDIHYIRNWSPILDLRIFLLSVFQLKYKDHHTNEADSN